MRSRRTGQSSKVWRVVVWSSRVRRNRRERKRRETPQTKPAVRRHHPWGIHNPAGGRSRESEWPIVVLTRGNARRAKGPHVSRVFRTGEQAA